ncbi:MAG: SgcJ/EcaC family oxidoreductase [Nocardioidaceae bacterium]
MSTSPAVVPAETPQATIDTLTARVAELERTQREEDVEGFLALFDPQATWVTGGGMRLVGHEAIAAFTRQVLPGAFAEGSVGYTVDLVETIAPDVVLTGVRQQYVDSDHKPTGAGSPSYVWRRTGGDWLIVVGQNTTVDSALLESTS